MEAPARSTGQPVDLLIQSTSTRANPFRGSGDSPSPCSPRVAFVVKPSTGEIAVRAVFAVRHGHGSAIRTAVHEQPGDRLAVPSRWVVVSEGRDGTVLGGHHARLRRGWAGRSGAPPGTAGVRAHWSHEQSGT
jgi:hypothetical protein